MFRYIKCMAKSRSDLAGDLEENSVPCMEHLIKLWLYPNSIHINHWRKEVYNFYPRIYRLKPRNKIPSIEFIYENVWKVDAHLKDRITHAILEYYEDEMIPDPMRLENLEDLYNSMKEYFRWLSTELHNNEYLGSQQVISKLISLGF